LPITSTNRASRELGDLDHPAHNEKKSRGKMQLGLFQLLKLYSATGYCIAYSVLHWFLTFNWRLLGRTTFWSLKTASLLTLGTQ
jgi:hypothetical protein